MSTNKCNDTIKSSSDEKRIWSSFSFTTRLNADDDSNSRVEADLNWGTILPPSSRFHDLVLFLRDQEHEIIFSKLQRMANQHERCVNEGDVKLNETRNEVHNLMNSLCTGVDSLQEIFQSLLNGKIEKYETYNRWEIERRNIEDEINEICQDSVEGRNYQSLLAKSRKMDLEIQKLEERLYYLKVKKKLIDNQVLETKSLVDIKINKLKDKLDSLLNNEKTETALLYKEKQLTSDYLTDTDVKRILQLDIEKIKPILRDLSDRKLQLEGSKICLKDVFDTLSSVEATMYILLKDEKTDQLKQLLASTKIHLRERLDLIQKYNVPYGEKIIRNEIKAIEKGLELLQNTRVNVSEEIPKSNDHPNYDEVNVNVKANADEFVNEDQTDITKLIPPSIPKALPTRLETSNFTATSNPTTYISLDLITDNENLRKEI